VKTGKHAGKFQATNVKEFWRAKCFAIEDGVALKGIVLAHCKWRRALPKAEAQVEEFGKKHGHMLLWSGNKYMPIRCEKCEWRACHYLVQLGKYEVVPCTGNSEAAKNNFEALKEWVRQYQKRKRPKNMQSCVHQFELHPYTAFCTKCGMYLHQKPRANSPADKDNCEEPPGTWARVKAAMKAGGLSLKQRRAMYDGKVL
jgi:hypothetical protein